ncbi:MAG: MotA/TolQ/ExbB proton channel family protein [Verrucomicrobia bacterium]|nr:MotA/TolQ/ExbB proton channel family protein [Verrucomicrobiota bacterium]
MAKEEIAPEILAGESQKIRPGTDVNIVIQLLSGVVGTLLVAFAVVPLKGGKLKYIYGVINERGPVQYFELFMAFMVAALIFLKMRIVKNQLTILGAGPVDPGTDLNDDDQIQDMRRNLQQRAEFAWSILLNRVDRLLSLWLGSKDIGRVATWAASESERDASSSDSSYSIARVLIWAIPILGFIGTVMGLGSAVSGFAEFLAGSAELSAIKSAIGNVTIGLGVAFDTTLLALVLSVILMLPLSSIERREGTLFVEIDNYLDDMLISRLPSPEQQPIVIENLEDSIEAAFRRYIPDPDRYDEVFTRSIERAAGVVEERFSNLSKGYETVLHNLTAQLSSSMATVGDSLEASMQKVVQDLQAQEDRMLMARKGVSEDEAQNFKRLVEDIHGAALKAADQYKESAEALQESTRDNTTRALSAASQLADRMQDVANMAAGIQDLLKIEEAVEKTLKGISASDEFQKTLQDIRQHLVTTDEFCTKLSKPRVITLTEEID